MRKVSHALKTTRSVLMVAPTGSGKTVMFSFIAKRVSESGRRVLILTHRDELLRQSSRTFGSIGLKHGLITSGRADYDAPVVVASVQTLANRIKKREVRFDFVIVDEAHLYRAKTFRETIDHFSQAKILACTATPIRTDGKGLGKIDGGFCEAIVEGPTTRSLIERGFLCPLKLFAPPKQMSLEGLTVRGGDYVQSEVQSRMDKASITGDAVSHYLTHARGERAIVFCSGVDHARHVAEQFNEAGVRSASIDGSTERFERVKRLDELKRGDLTVITSVDLITTGTDIPEVSVGIWLRPTKSLSLWLQGCGRILRTAPNKNRALILDHVGNSLNFGLPQTDREWTLEGVTKAKGNQPPLALKQCKQCFNVWDVRQDGHSCPHCGHLEAPPKRSIKVVEGELKELTPEEDELRRKALRRRVGQARTREELEEIARENNYKSGWVWHQMKHKKIN